MNRFLNQWSGILAIFFTCALILLGGAWERYLAPLRAGGTLFSLKILPLVPLLWGMLKGSKRSFQWSVLVIWLYVVEGFTRSWSDTGTSRYLALLEIVLALSLFAASTLWIRSQRVTLNDPAI